MNEKKPASLSSELLARKGEAQPFSVNPAERLTPYLNAEGGGTHFGGPRFDTAETDERAFPPEPEIILTPEELEEGEGRGKLIALIIAGVVVAGGVLFALSFQGGDRGVAPVAPELVAQAPSENDTLSELRSSAPVNDAPPAATAEPVTAAETPSPAPAETAAAVPPAATPAQQAPVASTPAATTPPVEVKPVDVKPVEKPAPAVAEKPAPKPEAAKPVAASGGAYVVQLLALRDEASAQKAWAGLQKKHPSLKGHASDIERADLGDKGVFYRLRAAGFASKAEAQSFCAKLKAAGQDCMVKAR